MPDNDSFGDAILNEILENEVGEGPRRASAFKSAAAPAAEGPEDNKSKVPDNYTQWALGGNGKFMPVGATAGKLPAGVYEPFAIPGMWGLERLPITSDGIYPLPDMATEAVLKEAKQFWASEAKYREHNLLYKRGIILWGPPGGGKTVTVKLLMNELVSQDGVVIVVNHIGLAIQVLKAVRYVEPNRKLIVVLEDIDDIINMNGESAVLSMLDGENNIDNVLNLATTNYPEMLGARIINRPSRFDRRILVGMPGVEARKAYLQKTTNNGLDDATLAKWVEETKEFSIAHLRELVAAVYCLGQPYEDVIDRLTKMAEAPKGDSGFKSGKMGFGRTKSAEQDFNS